MLDGNNFPKQGVKSVGVAGGETLLPANFTVWPDDPEWTSPAYHGSLRQYVGVQTRHEQVLIPPTWNSVTSLPGSPGLAIYAHACCQVCLTHPPA